MSALVKSVYINILYITKITINMKKGFLYTSILKANDGR